jgi:hypothetical protein
MIAPEERSDKPGLSLGPELPSGKFVHYLQSQSISQLSAFCLNDQNKISKSYRFTQEFKE